jgi:hypothetical protein
MEADIVINKFRSSIETHLEVSGMSRLLSSSSLEAPSLLGSKLGQQQISKVLLLR